MFDLKKDVYDLKQFVFQLAKSGNVNPEKLKDLEDDDNEYTSIFSDNIKTSSIMNRSDNMHHQPVILGSNDVFSESEEVEDSNSISDMEKQMILKSLKKFGGKRKDAANELGISERTLYRKIKEYKIDI
jgi:DNA-binding NtrC family response regulator